MLDWQLLKEKIRSCDAKLESFPLVSETIIGDNIIATFN